MRDGVWIEKNGSQRWEGWRVANTFVVRSHGNQTKSQGYPVRGGVWDEGGIVLDNVDIKDIGVRRSFKFKLLLFLMCLSRTITGMPRSVHGTEAAQRKTELPYANHFRHSVQCALHLALISIKTLATAIASRTSDPQSCNAIPKQYNNGLLSSNQEVTMMMCSVMTHQITRRIMRVASLNVRSARRNLESSLSDVFVGHSANH
ncbi:hypothetical protein BJY52DRAFT_1230401 [Lactarius psammicola]|nr:hypothetical protein BJY52DRAFT_1230401 [Lactarius psammicola]